MGELFLLLRQEKVTKRNVTPRQSWAVGPVPCAALRPASAARRRRRGQTSRPSGTKSADGKVVFRLDLSARCGAE